MQLIKPKFWDKKHSLLSILLFPFSLIYQLIFFIKKNLTFKRKLFIKVICVGNIYLGGTGKTPTCIEIFSLLKEINKNPAFVKKKYTEFDDETNLLNQNGKVFENKKRYFAIEDATRDGHDVVILDDGLQDFAINKDFSIVCFNENQLVGNNMIIPAGPLRESLKSLKRAQCVIINGEKNIFFESQIKKINADIKIYYSTYEPVNLNDFKNKRIVAFAGIGNPNNFFKLLNEKKLDIANCLEYPDHYKYKPNDLKNLFEIAKKNNAILLTTEKDFMRLGISQKNDINFLKVKIEIKNKNNLLDQIKLYI